MTETAGQFFERAQSHGRAVLVGTAADPMVWLARSILTTPDLSVCFDWLDEMRLVPASANIDAVKRMARRAINRVALKQPRVGSRRAKGMGLGEHIHRTKALVDYFQLAESPSYRMRARLKALQARLARLEAL